MIDRKIIIGVVLAIAIISGVFMVNKNPAVAEKEVGYDLINNDNSVVSAITSSCVKDGNLIIHISNPNNEKIQVIGLEGKKYKIKPDEVIIYDYKGEQFKLKIGSQSDVYEFGNWIKEGDKVYIDNSSWGRLEAYPHTIHSSGWVYFNVTVYKDFGDLDFLWGFNTSEVKPIKGEFYKPHFVNWTTNHSAFFYNVSSISTTDEPCDYGNEYNSYKRKITYQVCSQWNETTWECEKYNTTSAVVCFDSYEKNGTNYTAFWHTKHSRVENWINVGKYFNHIEHNYKGMNKWWYIKNFEIKPNKTYTARAYVKVPVTTEGTSGKYYFAVKRSAETLSEAISSGHFMVLDPWWNASWSRKRAIHINNTGNSNALTDYQVMINITYDSDMQNDFDDIRVVNETSGETVPYWIENKSDGNWCKIWFNASYIPASSWCNDTYYLYYGNPSASSNSDGEATFEFFDDFEDDTVGEFPAGWTVVEDASEIRVTDADAYSGTKCLRILDKGSQSDISYAAHDFPSQTLIAMDIAARIQANAYSVFGIAETIPGYQKLPQASLELGCNDQTLYYWSDGAKVSIESDDLQWHEYTIIADTTNYIKILKDGVVKVENKPLYASATSWKKVVLKPIEGTFSTSYDYYYDLIRVRKYADPEPTAELGNEEQQTTDTSFTVTLPAGYTYAHFNLTGVENPSTQTNYPPEGQSDTQAFYEITNTGNVNLTVKMKINATIPNVILKADTDNNPSGAKEINTTYATLCEDLPPDDYLNVWLWTDLSHAEEQETEKELEINVSQTT